ncbi:MAG: diaminopimelate epimerase [Sphingobacteriales bacterium]|jgi:diaminopimelate epimerase
MSTSLPFYKYQGTGNDFVIIDGRMHLPILSKAQIHFICDRRFGIGADGFMILLNKDGYDFEMTYYNADGNEGSMCGNGGRCLVKFAFDQGIHRSIYKFMAIDGEHLAEMADNGWVRLKMNDVEKVNEDHGNFILNTGSPHYVNFVNDLKDFAVTEQGKAIRYSDTFTKEGINVNFVENINDHTIFVRTYERGVEAETWSCGTGVTASALMSAHNELGFNKVDVKTLGGNLSVEYDRMGEQEFRNIWLCGPASYVFHGTIELND